MKKNTKSSFTSFLVVFIIAILALVVFYLGKKTTINQNIISKDPLANSTPLSEPKKESTTSQILQESTEKQSIPQAIKRELIDPQPEIAPPAQPENGFSGESTDLPPEMVEQLNSPPPELPEDLRQQLNSPPPELPAELKAQLSAPPPPIPDDIKRAMETPPRAVTEEEVNDPNWQPSK